MLSMSLSPSFNAIKSMLEHYMVSEKETVEYIEEHFDELKEGEKLCQGESKLADALFHLLEQDNVPYDQPWYPLMKPDGKLRKIITEDNRMRCDCSKELQKVDVMKVINVRDDYVNIAANKYVCTNCGKEYDSKDIRIIFRSQYVSDFSQSTVFYNEDKIVISTFAHRYKYMKGHLLYENENYRVIFNIKTGRQYAEPIFNKYRNKKTGQFRSFSAFSPYNFQEVLVELSDKQMHEIGNAIYEYVNDKDAIPFDEYINRKEGVFIENVKVLAAYNSNPFIHYEDYQKIVNDNRAANRYAEIKGKMYPDSVLAKHVKRSNIKIIRNKNILKEHQEYLDNIYKTEGSMSISNRARKAAYEVTKARIKDYDKLAEEIEILAVKDTNTDSTKPMAFSFVESEGINVTISHLTGLLFDRMSNRVFNHYVKLYLKEFKMSKIAGANFEAHRLIRNAEILLSDILTYDKDFKMNKKYDSFKELKDELQKSLNECYEKKYKINYDKKFIAWAKKKNIEIVDVISINLLSGIGLWFSFEDVMEGRAFISKEGSQYKVHEQKKMRKKIVIESKEVLDECATQN